MSDRTNSVDAKARRAGMADLPPGERQMIMKRIFVEHDRFREAYGAVTAFHFPVVGGVPDTGRVCVLAGDSRTGKTYALKRYAADHTASQGEDGMIRPVVYADMPIDASHRAVLEALAEPLTIINSRRMNNPTLFKAILAALVDQQVRLLILDEFQEVFTTSKSGMIRVGRGLLRKILNLETLNVVCAGLMDTYHQMVGDPQLTGRGGLPYKVLRPYEWETVEERQLFRLLCDEIDEALPFREKAGLGTVAVAHRLFYVTQGIIGRLTDFVYAAGCLAINDGGDRIEVRHFAQAWDMRKPIGTSFNPFTDDMSAAPQPKPADAALQDAGGDAFTKTQGAE